MQQLQQFISFEMFTHNYPSPWTFPLFIFFMQCKVNQLDLCTNILYMFCFLVIMFWFVNILFCLFRMGNRKCWNKKPKGRSGGRSHQNVCLNRWNEEAMVIAIQEYNNLCVQHGADNISIKAVAESYDIPTTMVWKRYNPELCPPELLLSI